MLGYAAPLFLMGQEGLSEANYRIYATAIGKEVTLKEIAAEMASHDVLFFGEEHNDSVTHYLQARMLEEMHKMYGSRLALSMEMFERDVQVVMDEYLAGRIREKHFTKDARVWSNYRDYKPMVEFCKSNGLEVVCANAASRYTNLAGREGQKALENLPKSSKVNFAPLPYMEATGGYYNKLMEFMHGPAPSSTDSAVVQVPVATMGGFNLIAAQSLWDATMAWSIAEYTKRKANKKKKVLQLNGRFHSDNRYAIVTQLAHYAPKLKSLVISSVSDDSFPTIDWTQYKDLGDYVIVTDPKVPKTFKSE